MLSETTKLAFNMAPSFMKVAHQPVAELTSLRFFAAVLVVFFHYLPRTDEAASPGLLIINHGFVGVSFFFVLSGFILAYRSSDVDYTQRDERRRFYSRRIARVYPAFATATLLQWPVFAYWLYASLGASDGLARVFVVTLPTFLLVQSWLPWTLGQLNAPSWTISVEIFLYFSLPRLLNYARRATTTQLVLWAVAAWAVCWLTAWMLPFASKYLISSGSLPAWWRSPYPVAQTWISSFPVFHLGQFCVGMLAGHFAHRLYCPEQARVIAPFGTAAAGALIAGALLLPWEKVEGIDVAMNNGALAPLFACLFASIAIAPQSRELAFLRWQPLVALGDASYAMYIFQQPVFQWGKLLCKQFQLSNTGLVFFFSMLLLLIMLSLIFSLVDARIRPQLAGKLQSLLSTSQARRR